MLDATIATLDLPVSWHLRAAWLRGSVAALAARR
jgi:hypothetical protein